MSKEMAKPASRMKDLLEERQRLDQFIRKNFSKEVSILFSDICNYTQYTDKKGDVRSRAMLLKHNQLVLPAVENNHGKILEVVGDGVMAFFNDPHNAIEAAVTIHNVLGDANHELQADEEIHVKIGIHMGNALLDESAHYQGLTGDVANVAARIQKHAGQDEILISHSVFASVKTDLKWFCRFYGDLAIKGKSEHVPVYSVVWHPTEPILQTPLSGKPDPRAETRTLHLSDRRVVTLEIGLEETLLNVSIHEKSDHGENTLRQYETMDFAADRIDQRCKMLVETLNKSNRRGQVSGRQLKRLKETGQLLYDELLSLKVKEFLHRTDAETMILNIDDLLVHIPWELLFDGRQFFCTRFSMGRIVRTKQVPATLSGCRLSAPINMLVLADPTGDLKNAYTEGVQIRDFLDQNPSLINASLCTDYISSDTLKTKLRDYDLIHFAGHADYSANNPELSGWRLPDSTLTTEDITRMAGSATMPTMVFANACQSARTAQWLLDGGFEHRIYGMANAFLLAGVKLYIGTFWEILDEPGSLFAIEFYRQFFSGKSVGEAVLKARKASIDLYGEETIIWSSYVLYGDPTFNYLERIGNQSDVDSSTENPSIQKVAKNDRTRDEIVNFKANTARRNQYRWWLVAATVLLIAGIGWWTGSWIRSNKLDTIEQKAMAHFLSGEYKMAEQLCRKIRKEAPNRPLSALILGQINLSSGQQEDAGRFYRTALNSGAGSIETQTEALMGLGRLASIDSEWEQAIDYYNRASNLDPTNTRAIVSQAVLLERQGNLEDALLAYRRASSLSPNDISLKVAANQVQNQMFLREDDARQDRIDKLIDDILGTKEHDEAPSANKWTSAPITLWLLDFRTIGINPEEGTERLIHGLLTHHLIKNVRVQVAERALLDKLLAELKIGASSLTQDDTALSVGRLAAAKIVLFGRFVFLRNQLKISIRMVDTETGVIKAALIEAFSLSDKPEVVAERLAYGILQEIQWNYPIRATLSDIKQDVAIIDVGQRLGVCVGMIFSGPADNIAVRIISVGATHSKADILLGKSELYRGAKLIEQKKRQPTSNVLP